MTIDLSPLFEKQKELDSYIHHNHHVDYTNTFSRRLLALLVELGEFANATRCFKFWSNKGMEEKARILDEYADGLHFLLSLGIAIGNNDTAFKVADDDLDLVSTIIKTYSSIIDFSNKNDFVSYHLCFEQYLKIYLKLGFTFEEVQEAYLKKLQINFDRQNNNY